MLEIFISVALLANCCTLNKRLLDHCRRSLANAKERNLVCESQKSLLEQ